MAVLIKPITLDDAVGFGKVLDSVAKERRYLVLLEAPHTDQVEKAVRAGIERHVPHFVALDGNEVVGWCDIRPRTESGFTHTGRLGMGVRADYRRRGIGRWLVGATLQEAHSAGLRRVELEVFSSNIPAVHLYKSFGFAEEGRARQARYLDGKWDDVLQMGLILSP